MDKSNYKQLVHLLKTAEGEFSDKETIAIRRCADFFGQLDDHVLTEVTRFAVATCAFRLAKNPQSEVAPTPELLKHALLQTLSLLKESVKNDF